MRRVLIFGRGGAGKSTASRRLGSLIGLPVIELDTLFWQAGPAPLGPTEWAAVQERTASADAWIMDGDLGPYDVVAPRLRRADTVLVLDYSLHRCAWRALRRGRERIDFWVWTVTWRWRYRPRLREAIATYAPEADVVAFRCPRQLDRWMNERSAPASPDAGPHAPCRDRRRRPAPPPPPRTDGGDR